MPNHVQRLMRSLADHSACIGVIGLGYVGLPLLKTFWAAGCRVIGFDIDREKIDALHAGRNYLRHLGEQFVQPMAGSDRFDATVDARRLGEPDALIICVPTPLNAQSQPDLSFIQQAADAIAATDHPGRLIVLESTTYPGTTRQILLPRLQQSRLRCGKDFFLAFSPEREDPGRKDHATATIPKLVGGIDPISAELAVTLYRSAVRQVVPVASAEVAEAAKMLENAYRAVNIAMVNELKMVFDAMGIDIWQVIDAAATKPFGYHPFFPGPGMGGHCIPIDPLYLAWKARQVGQPTRFIELASQINQAMPHYVVRRIDDALRNRSQTLADARILVLGLAYKPDVEDVRESPGLALIRLLRDQQARVDYHDPHVPTSPPPPEDTCDSASPKQPPLMRSIDLTPDAIAAYDCVLIVTHHSVCDWQMIADHARLILDTRNALQHVTGPRDHILKA